MPTRTREHALESESFKKFESLVPSKWVFRKKDSDYGVDGEIEIFDENGKTTGLFINVQLKSTGAKDLKDCLKETFKVETLEYYSTLEYPVLIAKYSSTHDKIYFTWAHGKNHPRIQKDQTYVTVQFLEDNHLTKDSFSHLHKDVVNYIAYKKQKIIPPFKFYFVVKQHTVNKPNLTQKFRLYASAHEVHIKPVEDTNRDAIGIVVFANDKVMLSIGGASATFEFPLPDSDDKIIADLNIALAILLSQVGYNILSATLAEPVYEQSTFFKKPGLLKGLLECFYEANKLDLVFKACKWAIEQENCLDEVLIFSALLYHHHKRTSQEEQDLVEKIYLLLNQYYSGKNYKVQLASSHYNLGNLYGNKGRQLKAIHHYNMARKVNPSYAERHYLWREIGSDLFNSGKMLCANKAYLKSLEIEEEYDVRAKYADTLLYLGRYSEAKKEFKIFLESGKENSEPFWHLKLIILENITQQFVIKDGKRDRIASEKTISIALEQANRRELFEAAVCLDPMNSFQWFELGHIYFDEKNYERSFLAYSWAALCNDKNMEAWAYAFIIPFSNAPKTEDTATLLARIFMAAYERNGESFISYLFDFITSRIVVSDEIKEGMKARILALVDELQREEKLELRIVEKDMVIRKMII